MPAKHFQFRLPHLFVVTTYLAAVVAGATYIHSFYEVEGAVGALFLGLLFVLFVIASAICLCFRRLRIVTLVASLVVCGLLISRESILIQRLRHLKTEVARIVTYVETFKNAHGQFPPDLSCYEYLRPDLRPYIAYSPPRGVVSNGATFGVNSYQIRYHPTNNEGIAHWYFGDQGYWYEDD
jgi:hypothetical protein